MVPERVVMIATFHEIQLLLSCVKSPVLSVPLPALAQTLPQASSSVDFASNPHPGTIQLQAKGRWTDRSSKRTERSILYGFQEPR